MKLDQYLNMVPSDLVLLDSSWLDWLTEGELKWIDLLEWYKPRANRNIGIFVSAAKLSEALDSERVLDYYGPENFYLEKSEWDKIDGPLHRWNPIDGFYDA